MLIWIAEWDIFDVTYMFGCAVDIRMWAGLSPYGWDSGLFYVGF